ncbi:unnamed protein product, partial [Amoebophrya sp. A25]|eukprot:GSA25T00004415001.1
MSRWYDYTDRRICEYRINREYPIVSMIKDNGLEAVCGGMENLEVYSLFVCDSRDLE